MSTASRFIFYLKGNLCLDDSGDSSTIHRHARRLFWITYVCDKGFTLVTGLAPRIDEANCDLNLEESDDGHGSYSESYLRQYVLLAFLQSRIYRYLYSPSASKQSDAQLLQHIRDLDISLEEWRNALPTDSRPSLSLARKNGCSRHVDIRASIFHLQYHHSLIMIHQVTSRCTSWLQNKNFQATGSSLAISITASRSLLGGFVYSSFELGTENLL